MKRMNPELISIQDYATDHGITAATMRQRIQRGMHPEAVKIAKVWLIPRDAPFVDHRGKGITRRYPETKKVLKNQIKNNERCRKK